jgi:hypothetical protein
MAEVCLLNILAQLFALIAHYDDDPIQGLLRELT